MAENLSLRQFSHLHRVLAQGWESGIRNQECCCAPLLSHPSARQSQTFR